MFNKVLKTKISFLFILMLMLCGCKNATSTSTLDKNLCPLPLDSITLKLDPLEKYFKSYSGYIYIMNSECSECIGTLISFINDLDKSGYRGTVLAIITPATQPIINHYIKEQDFPERITIKLLESKKDEWGINSIENFNGMVYYLKENAINKIYQYFPIK